MKNIITVAALVLSCGLAFGDSISNLSQIVGGATRSDVVTIVNYHRYAKQSSAELIAEGAIS